MDRSYALFANYKKLDLVSLVKDKPVALIMIGGGMECKGNAEESFVAFDRYVKALLASKAGELFVDGCHVPEDIDEERSAQGIAFAEAFLAQAGAATR